jgi:hypothetical protein
VISADQLAFAELFQLKPATDPISNHVSTIIAEGSFIMNIGKYSLDEYSKGC